MSACGVTLLVSLCMASFNPYNYWESPYPSEVYGQFVNNFYGYSRPGPSLGEPERTSTMPKDPESSEFPSESSGGACEEIEEVSLSV